jgi:hypothetical protein
MKKLLWPQLLQRLRNFLNSIKKSLSNKERSCKQAISAKSASAKVRDWQLYRAEHQDLY